MRRPVALALVVLVFVSGVVAGIVGTHVYYLRRLGHPGAVADLALEVGARKLTRRLDLRPDQRRELDRILEDARGDIAVLRRDAVGRLRDIRDAAARRLDAVLDEKQREELRRIREEQGQLFERYLR